MEFKYFKGPIDEMSDLLEDKVTCSICGNIDYCFELEYTTTNEFTEDEREGKVGCVNCLKKGLFEFWHDTELGMLGKNGLHKMHNQNNADVPLIEEDKLIELKRTPRFITWQQELWLTHCNDFMVYMGTWTPNEFYANSQDGDGRRLFMEMTDDEYNSLWDDSLADGQIKLEEWYPTYYVFECAHCGKLRGNWDCD